MAPAAASDAAMSDRHNAPRGRAPGRGAFVTFEGGEGSGKSTQLRRLAAHLGSLGRTVLTTREPGGTLGAEIVRRWLLDGRARALGEHAEAALFAAARADHVAARIAPALARGDTVLCDRYVDSSRAYQAGDPLLPHLERAAVDGTMPDLTLIYDVDPALGTARVRERDGGLDRFEASGLAEQERRRDAFRRLAESEPERCALIDARGTREEVEGRTLAALAERMPDLLR